MKEGRIGARTWSAELTIVKLTVKIYTWFWIFIWTLIFRIFANKINLKIWKMKMWRKLLFPLIINCEEAHAWLVILLQSNLSKEFNLWIEVGNVWFETIIFD